MKVMQHAFHMAVDQNLPRELASDLSYRQRWGLAATLRRKLIERLDWTAGFHIYGIYSRLMVAPSRQDPVLPGYCARLFLRGDEQELLACAKRPELELDAEFVHAALGKGDVCAAVLHNGQIVAFDWTAFTPTRVSGAVHVEFDRSYRYGYFAYTLPEYRGRHLARLVMPQRDRYILQQGRNKSIAYISIDNEASLRRSAALGSHRVGFAGYLKRGPVFVPFRTEGVREHGFRFFKPEQSA